MNPLYIALLLFFGTPALALAPQQQHPFINSNVVPAPMQRTIQRSTTQTDRPARLQTLSTTSQPSIRVSASTVQDAQPTGAPQPIVTPQPPAAPQPAVTIQPSVSSQPITGPTDFASQVAADVFADTNQERAQNGLAPLTQNQTLVSIAQSHAADMLANNYFEHNDLTGCSPSCRLTNAGYAWQAMGENIYEMSGYDLDAAGTADQIVQGWMNSPEHRANILDVSYIETGVGIAAQGSTVYATSDYAEPRVN
ncbi:MAG TPA: CAP domain-containing protein [Candidatus Paceibacterota bacterium]|jgi:uncharacterized protein YkwD|nr:CAP domain-containing protein [Candidatus Paceibacterota bacterium]